MNGIVWYQHPAPERGGSDESSFLYLIFTREKDDIEDLIHNPPLGYCVIGI